MASAGVPGFGGAEGALAVFCGGVLGAAVAAVGVGPAAAALGTTVFCDCAEGVVAPPGELWLAVELADRPRRATPAKATRSA